MAIPHDPNRPHVSRPPGLTTIPVTFSAITPIAMTLDALLIVITAVATGFVYHRFVLETTYDLTAFSATGALVALFFYAIMDLRGRYRPERLLTRSGTARDVVFGWTVTFALLFAFAFLLKFGGSLSRGSIVSFFLVGLVLVLAGHVTVATWFRRAVRDGRLRGRSVLLVGDVGVLAEAGILDDLARHGYRVADFVAARFDEPEKDRDGLAGSIVEATRTRRIEEVLVYAPWTHRAAAEDVIRRLTVVPLPVGLLLEPAIADLLARPVTEIGTTAAIEMQRAPLTLAERAVKRGMDIAIAGAGLVALSPIMLAAALLVKSSSPGPVIFRQTRHGFGRRRFTIYKFRSMTVTESNGHIDQARRNDPRVTPVGRILRRTSIDELPQLFNVLRGDMSIVGPRPHAVSHDDIYERQLEDYAFRHHMKPGLTGWAQVNGFRGETRDLDQMRRRVEHDLWYVDNWSPVLDLAIMVRTVAVLFFQRNAY
jgi:Undecaprenyl-phosphate glucose phosphotransferase